MDVGTIVESSGLFAALFALLACVSLAVELGRRPPKPKKMFVEDEELLETEKPSKVEPQSQVPPAAKAPAKPSVEIPSRGFGSPVIAETAAEVPGIPEIPFDQVQPTIASAYDFAAERKAALAQDNLLILQRTYVDGFLSPRGKYDVALAILNEYRVSSTMAFSENVGQTMATEAYLSATRTGKMESERAPFLAGLMKTILTPSAESTTDDTNSEAIDKQKNVKPSPKKSEKSESLKRTSSPDGTDISASSRSRGTTDRRKPPSSRSRNRNSRD
ncbi:hypothetical protein KF728_08860 [Candidatus Obscuribacterales bacterium]|jgi:hypothetical protein|nr:hypothetical protein [Candidatus Obscuribacterales bacterium]